MDNNLTSKKNSENINSNVLIAINHFPPSSPEGLLKTYKGLREPNELRDLEYSPLHDSIMEAISSNLKEHSKGTFDQIWTSSLFPERVTKEILRLFEMQLQRGI